MRNFIWNLFAHFFQKEIRTHVDSFKNSHYYELKTQSEIDRVYFNYPKGTKVIIRSNEPEDLVIGPVIGYFEHQNSKKVLLIVRNEKTGDESVSLNNTPPYWTQERENALRKLNWAEQWNVMTQFYNIDLEHQRSKESPEYQNRNQKKD